MSEAATEKRRRMTRAEVEMVIRGVVNRLVRMGYSPATLRMVEDSLWEAHEAQLLWIDKGTEEGE